MGKTNGSKEKKREADRSMASGRHHDQRKLLPVMTLLPWKAQAAQQGDTITAYGSGFHHYCIDGAGANRALIDGDLYEYILPSETLSREEAALVFWGMLTLQASFRQYAADQCCHSEYQCRGGGPGCPGHHRLCDGTGSETADPFGCRTEQISMAEVGA